MRLLFFFLWILAARAQAAPSFDLSRWEGPSLKEHAGRFFSLLAQEMAHPSPFLPAGDAFLAVIASGGVDGRVPGLENPLNIRPLPRLSGGMQFGAGTILFAHAGGLSDGGDLLSIEGIGVAVAPRRSEWLLSADIAQLEGADDFDLKSAGLALSRKVNFYRWNVRLGVAMREYRARVRNMEILDREAASTAGLAVELQTTRLPDAGIGLHFLIRPSQLAASVTIAKTFVR